MGLFPWAKFTIASVELQPGDLLFSYTDGVNEAKDTEGDQFGDERIVDNAELGRGGAGEFVSGMLEQIKSFRGEAPQSDDITMLAVRRLGGA